MRITHRLGRSALTIASIAAWAVIIVIPPSYSDANAGASDVDIVAQAISEGRSRPDASDTRGAYTVTQETGQLDAADIAKAIALIERMSTVFERLAESTEEGPTKATWSAIHNTYEGAELALRALLVAGRIEIAELPAGSAGTVLGNALTVDATLDGRWQPESVWTKRKIGEDDWSDISRLAGVLFQQLVLWDGPKDWAEWLDVHQKDPRFGTLAVERGAPTLTPYLVRFWHIQDKQLANQLSRSFDDSSLANRRRADRESELHNEMLATLKRVELAAGWDWRDRLETAWTDFGRHLQIVAAARGQAEPEVGSGRIEQPSTPSEPPSPDLEPPFAHLTGVRETPDTDAENLSKLRREIEALHVAIRARDADIGVLRDLLESAQAKGEELGSLVKAQAARINEISETVPIADRIQEGLTQLSARLATMEERLNERPSATAQDGLRDEITQLREAAETLRQRVALFEEGTSVLATRLETTGQLTAEIGVDLGSLRKNLRDVGEGLRAEITTLKGRLSEVLTRADQGVPYDLLTQLRGGAEDLQNRAARMEGGLSELTVKLDSIDQHVDANREGLADLRQRIVEIGEQLRTEPAASEETLAESQVGEQRNLLGVQIAELGSATEELRDRTVRLEAAVTSLSANMSSGDEQVAAIRAELDALPKEMEGIRERLIELQASADREGLHEALAEFRTTLETMESGTSTLQERLDALTTKIESTDDRVGEMRGDLVAVRNETVEIEEQFRAEAGQRQTMFLTAIAVAAVIAVALIAVIVVSRDRERRPSHGPEAPKRRATGPSEAPYREATSSGGKRASAVEIRESSAAAPATAETETKSLRSEIAELRSKLEGHREQAANLEQRLVALNAELRQNRKKAARLRQDLASVREGNVMIGRGLLDQIATRNALYEDLDRLRDEIGAEREWVKEFARKPSDEDAVGIGAEPSAEATITKDRGEPTEVEREDALQAPPKHNAPVPEERPEVCERVRTRAITALDQGDIQLFEVCFSQLAGLPLPNIRGIVCSPGGKDLAIGCRAVRIEEPYFVTAFMLSRTDKSGQSRIDPFELSRAMEFYEQIGEAEAKEILTKWRSALHCNDGSHGQPKH